MPPSNRRTRPARKAAEVAAAATATAADVSDADTPESIATPSRTSRKRARANDAPTSNGRAATRRKVTTARANEREDTEGTEANEQSDAETEPSTPSEVDVISKLKVSDKQVNATHDFSNDLLEGREHVPGYGKIAGRNWTYIIQGVEINIGRPESHEKAETLNSPIIQSNDPSAKSRISIDLGPDRQVSRLHAVISYDSEQEKWFITVNGRNGLRVDTQLLKRGNRAALRSGCVIDISGTQMAFITTARHEDDGPVFADAIVRQTYTSEEEDHEADGRNGNPPPNPSSHMPGPSSSVRRPAHPSSSFPDGSTGHRVHPHSYAGLQSQSFPIPGTPIRNHGMNIPTSQRTRPSPLSTGGYSRGVMLESTESIDYSADSAKDLKPPHSYAQLIGMAILSTGEQQMTLNNIYKWIMANYAFYRYSTSGWQNSIRHNLSLNKAFEKIARRTDEPGKGMKWMISPKERDTFLSQGMKGCRRPNPLPSGMIDPSSPAQLQPPSSAHQKLNGAVHAVPSKTEKSDSPPMHTYPSSYPTATEAYTPDRGSRRPVKFDENDPELVYPPSAKSTLNHLTAVANAAGSPPSLYINDDGRIGPLDTPFPVRSSQKLAPPSTLQRPSAFMEFSSPAPFWKFGSTPLRPLADISPLKATPFSSFKPLGMGANVKVLDEDDKSAVDKKSILDEKDDDMPAIQSSSPPRASGVPDRIDGSPTRSIPRPATSHSRSAKLEFDSEEHIGTSMPPESNERTSFERESSQKKEQSIMTNPSFNAPQLQPPQQQQPESEQQQEVQPGQQEQVQTQQQREQSNMPAPNSMRPPMQALGNGTNQQQAPAAPNTSNILNSHAYATNNMNGMQQNMGSLRYGADTDDEAGIDLAKGFQPIGTFHKIGAARFGMGMAGR
ncbi:hypothetical protein KCU85_g555, partial [Aureobasidium melanogenum]